MKEKTEKTGIPENGAYLCDVARTTAMKNLSVFNNIVYSNDYRVQDLQNRVMTALGEWRKEYIQNKTFSSKGEKALKEAFKDCESKDHAADINSTIIAINKTLDGIITERERHKVLLNNHGSAIIETNKTIDAIVEGHKRHENDLNELKAKVNLMDRFDQVLAEKNLSIEARLDELPFSAKEFYNLTERVDMIEDFRTPRRRSRLSADNVAMLVFAAGMGVAAIAYIIGIIQLAG